MLHLTVGVTGDVHQDAAAGERTLEAGEWHHGENLTYTPGIGQGLEQGEVREALVCQLLGELVGQGAVVAVDRVEQLLERQAGVLVQHLGPGALLQVQEAHGVLGVDVTEIRHGVVEDLQQGGIFPAQVQPPFPHVLQDGGRVLVRGADVVHLHPFGTNDIGDQHGVVCSQGTAGLADDGRVRQVELAADIADAPDHVVGVLGEAVVRGAVALGTGALVVHTQAAAHVHHLDLGAKTAQLGVEAAALADAALDVADVGDLGAQVEVQQLQAVQLAEAAQTLHQRQDLGGGEAELGHGTAARFPHAGAGGRQTGAHPDVGLDVETSRLVEHHFQLGGLLHHDVDLVAHQVAQEGVADVFAVLVTVADDHGPLLMMMGQHGQQLRFGARLQPKPRLVAVGLTDGLDDAALLVYLDRVNAQVVPFIA